MKKTTTRNNGLLALLFAVLLVFSGCGAKIPKEIDSFSLPFVDENIVTTFSPVLPQQRYKALASENQRLMYKAMLLAIKDQAAETLAIPGDLTDDEVSAVYDAVSDDYPQFFEPSLTCNIVREKTNSGKVKSVLCQLTYIESDPSKATARRQALYDTVNKILADAASITDPLQRERFFYEKVIFAAKYDRSQAELFSINLDTHTAYGDLVIGLAVCDGYAKAFELLCNYGGIEAWTESGYFEGTSHAWNGVKINGQIYYCDPTVDDTESRYYGADKNVLINPDNPETLTALPDAATMLYFNVTRTEMSANHVFKSDANPEDATSAAPAAQGVLTFFTDKNALSAWMAQTLSGAQAGSGYAVALDFSINKSEFASMISSAGVKSTCLFVQNGANTRYYVYVI